MSKTCPVCATVYEDSDAFCPKDGTTLRMDETAKTLVGSVIADRYLVSKLLGEGGMGQVYLAGHVRLPQQAAIKVLHSSMVQDAAAIARFNREAANAARIEHERVARVFDFGETSNGLVYLAMEFVPGRTLTAVLKEAGRLSPERAANIVYQVADGLEAAHRISIVHRDLKPDNILVVSDDSGADKCKVVDFGIAKAFDGSENRNTQLTQAGAIIGTPEFMSPEQVLGEHLDARSDVYALAVVAYHLLTGQLPFVAATPERSLTMRLIQDPSPLSETAPDVEWPPALQQALDRALAREPEERTPSALQFAEEVIAATEGWTGGMVLRGRTPAFTASLTAARQAASSGASGSTTALRGAPTIDMPSAPASRKASAAGSSAGAAAAASKFGSTGSVAAGAGASSAATANRMPMLAGVLVVAAIAVGGGLYLTRGGDTDGTAGGGTSPSPAAVPTLAADDAAEAGTRSRDAAPDAASNAATGAAANTISSSGSESVAQDQTARAPVAEAAPPTANQSPPPEEASKALPTAPPGSAEASGREAVEREFNAIKTRLRNASATADYEQEIPKLRALLPRYSSAFDSTWVYISLIAPYKSVGDDLGTCSALKYASRLATSRQQLDAVRQYKDALPECL